jgi:hypothetical protein
MFPWRGDAIDSDCVTRQRPDDGGAAGPRVRLIRSRAAGGSVAIRDVATGLISVAPTNAEGRYHLPAITAGTYQVTVEARGFRSERIESLTFEVGRTLVRDFHLAVDTQREAVVVNAELPLLDRATSVVGHIVSSQTVQEIPLNGRHFVDLGMLVPGSVAPPRRDSRRRRSAARARSRSRPPATARRPSATSSTA